MMEEQQKAAEKQEEELIEELEQEITELKMRNTELEQLSHTEDNLHLLQVYSSLCSPTNTRNRPEISMKTHESLETLRRALTQLKDTIDEKLTLTVSAELKVMQQYAVDVTLDPDVAHRKLILSDDGKQPSGLSGPHRSGQGQLQKIMSSVSLTEDVQLNKVEKVWKPSVKRSGRADEDEPEFLKTQELFKHMESVLNQLTPQMFQPLMKQVTKLTIDTEERLKGVVELILEKAISEPNFSEAYANMCRCLMGLKVPTTEKPGMTINFRKLLLNRCQIEFEKNKDDDETFEKQKKLDAATGEEEKQRLKEDLEDVKEKARRRSLGNIKFTGELFKLKMLTEFIMHDCIVKLLKNHDNEKNLECLCCLLSTIWKHLDLEKTKPRMDQYVNQMEKIIKERKTSSRIRFMLQDVLDLRRLNRENRL
ncbi:eukaryotic translation initiation factor 4 gamma 1-like [Sinocyclocheilus grahami]|uniref:eukaryotic translation initiation factor 4 gamma 1-like n=1 Tax=Sinocyclocheilus grahami TaxID=75366 RepID=UPI0007AD2F35|nr:PREDICTED: eukaryotic translation initiation factor 4 gamma 1-like [Sinocyclocheilus grahami]